MFSLFYELIVFSVFVLVPQWGKMECLIADPSYTRHYKELCGAWFTTEFLGCVILFFCFPSVNCFLIVVHAHVCFPQTLWLEVTDTLRGGVTPLRLFSVLLPHPSCLVLS